jgi:hypothetical protein
MQTSLSERWCFSVLGDLALAGIRGPHLSLGKHKLNALIVIFLEVEYITLRICVNSFLPKEDLHKVCSADSSQPISTCTFDYASPKAKLSPDHGSDCSCNSFAVHFSAPLESHVDGDHNWDLFSPWYEARAW